ncbi:Uncharacterised protein [uncultured archaeon]|nr:Uncharacterised protein [uncultured archaeon]
MDVPHTFNKESLPPVFSLIVSAEEADVILSQTPFTVKQKQFYPPHPNEPPTAQVIKQFHTNEQYRLGNITLKTQNHDKHQTKQHPMHLMQCSRDLFGFVAPEGLLRRQGIHLLADALTNHIVKIKGSRPLPENTDGPTFFNKNNPPLDSTGKPYYPHIYSEYIEAPAEDSDLLVKYYTHSNKERTRLDGLFRRAHNKVIDSDDPLMKEIISTQEKINGLRREYETEMFRKYEPQLISALNEVGEKGFRVVHPGLNFRWRPPTKNEEGKVVFFEISSLPSYQKIADCVRKMQDEEMRKYAGDVLGLTLCLEEMALKRIVGWVDNGVVGRHSMWGQVNGAQTGRVPYPLCSLPVKFNFDDGTLTRRWHAGIVDLMQKNRDLYPNMEVTDEPLSSNKIRLAPNIHKTIADEITQIKNAS